MLGDFLIFTKYLDFKYLYWPTVSQSLKCCMFFQFRCQKDPVPVTQDMAAKVTVQVVSLLLKIPMAFILCTEIRYCYITKKLMLLFMLQSRNVEYIVWVF